MSETLITPKKKRIPWNKGVPRTEEAKRKQRETVLRKYGVVNISQAPDIKEKISEIRSSEEWKSKVKETKQERYGDPNYNNMDKNLKTKKERYGNSNYNNAEKMVQSKRKNKSFNTSTPEKLFYRYLTEKYGDTDIIRQYKDSRYPFCCDFYIRSKDLFIELNIHPTHNFKPFNSSDENHLRELEELREKAKASEYYKATMHTWTESDPLKLETARQNNLNYIAFYSNKELKEAIESQLI